MNKLVPKFANGNTKLTPNGRLNAFDAYGNPNGLRNPLLNTPEKINTELLPRSAVAEITPTTGVDSTKTPSAPVVLPKPSYDTGLPNLDTAKVNQAISQNSGAILATGKATAEALRAAKAAKATADALKAANAAKNIGTTGAAGAQVGTAAAKGAATAATGATSAAVGAVTSLGLSLAGTGLGIAGQAMENKSFKRRNLKGYGVSQVAEYAGKGLSAGSAIGGLFGAPGALIGGAIGTAAGAIGGGIYGMWNKKKVLKGRDEADKFIADANAFNNSRYKMDTIKYNDIQNSRNAMQYKRGGILKYKREESIGKPVANIPTKKKLKDTPIFALGGTMQSFLDPNSLPEEEQQQLIGLLQNDFAEQQKTGKPLDMDGLTNIASKYNLDPQWLVEMLQAQQEQSSQPTYKKGGKMKLKAKVKSCNCGCSDKPMMFRRGGSLDLEKSNVIVDGPSHGEFNNTGVKGDKGLPIVKNGHKIAEIESGELIINKESSDKIQQLRKEAIKGDAKAKENLGKLLHEELAKNTYDYTTLL